MYNHCERIKMNAALSTGNMYSAYNSVLVWELRLIFTEKKKKSNFKMLAMVTYIVVTYKLKMFKNYMHWKNYPQFKVATQKMIKI